METSLNDARGNFVSRFFDALLTPRVYHNTMIHQEHESIVNDSATQENSKIALKMLKLTLNMAKTFADQISNAKIFQKWAWSVKTTNSINRCLKQWMLSF